MAAFGSSISPEIPSDPALNPFAPKRYSQYQAMFKHFFTNDQLMKTYGYGCYCLNLGDRPLAGVMTGVYPVDEKDKHCFEFTRCNRCVTFDFGPDCTPEQVEYDVRYSYSIAYCILFTLFSLRLLPMMTLFAKMQKEHVHMPSVNATKTMFLDSKVSLQ